MRKVLERIIIIIFDLLPKRLSIRSLFIYWGILPYVIVKFFRRSRNNSKKRKIRDTTVNVSVNENVLKEIKTIQSEFEFDGNYCGDEEICIRYSGGTDSTLTAAYMGSRYRKVHLLTFASSYEAQTLYTIRSSPQNAGENVKLLTNRFRKDRFVHRILSLEGIRDSIYFEKYQRIITHNDYLRVSLCPACTVAMHILTIKYCKENNIRVVTDGSCVESGCFPWQMQYRKNLDIVISKYVQAGINYLINPCYMIEDSAEALYRYGILPERVDRKSFRYRRKTQQFCVPIQLQSFCRNIHGKEFPVDAEKVTEFIEKAFEIPC